VKYNLVMGALEQRLILSEMVTDKSSIVICFELQVFCSTTNQLMCFVQLGFSKMKVLLVGFLSHFKANMMELGLFRVKCPNLYGIYGLESSK